jgi:hypothetical protein
MKFGDEESCYLGGYWLSLPARQLGAIPLLDSHNPLGVWVPFLFPPRFVQTISALFLYF